MLNTRLPYQKSLMQHWRILAFALKVIKMVRASFLAGHATPVLRWASAHLRLYGWVPLCCCNGSMLASFLLQCLACSFRYCSSSCLIYGCITAKSLCAVVNCSCVVAGSPGAKTIYALSISKIFVPNVGCSRATVLSDQDRHAGWPYSHCSQGY